MNTPSSIWIGGAGLTCALGNEAMPVAAAIDAGLVRTRPTRFRQPPHAGRSVGTVPGLLGDTNLRTEKLLTEALASCRSTRPPAAVGLVPVFVGWAEHRRPGAPVCPSTDSLAAWVHQSTGIDVEPEDIEVVLGDTAGLRSLAAACERLRDDSTIEVCLVCAADSWLNASSLAWLWSQCLATPGEAGVAIWVTRKPIDKHSAQVLGGSVAHLSSGKIPVIGSLLRAVEHALAKAAIDFDEVDLRVSDSGTVPALYAENTLVGALLRYRARPQREVNPARSVGTTGAAAGLINVVLASYLLGRDDCRHALCTASSTEASRVAIVLCGQEREEVPGTGATTPWAL